jgi:hypothetical protein
MNAEATTDAADIADGGGFRGANVGAVLGYAARPLIVLAVALLVASIDQIGGALDREDVFYVRTLNLLEGAPTLDVMLGDTVISTAEYGGGTHFNAVPSGSKRLMLKATSVSLDGDGVTIDPVGRTLPAFVESTPYTLIAYGKRADPHVFALEAWGQRDSVAGGNVILQFAHAAPNTPRIDVFVTAAEAGTTISRYVASLSLTEASIPLELTLRRDPYDVISDSMLVGTVVIELRSSASGETLYRSSEINVVERHRTLFAIADGERAGEAGVRLVTLDTAAPES